MKGAIFILPFLFGCSSFGSNITESKSIETKGTEKVDAAFEQDRRTEAPQPSNVTVTASGNSVVNFTPVEEIPFKTDSSITGKKLKSTEVMDQTISELFEQHSSMFYLIIAFAFILFVIGLKRLESTKTAKALFTVGSSIGKMQRRLMQTDKSDPQHAFLSEMLDDLRDERDKIK